MGKIWDMEWVHSFFLALILIGVLALGYGVVRYFTLSYTIGQNLAYQIQSQGGAIDPQTLNEAQGLMAADQDLRAMLRDRNLALMAGGAGLIALAIGWFGRDMGAARRREASADASAGRPRQPS